MKFYGNSVKAQIASYHNIDPEMVIMNALCWEVLVEEHAAFVRYSIDGDKYSTLPYAAVIINLDIYIWENDSIKVETSADIEKTLSTLNWLSLSERKKYTGDHVLWLLDLNKGRLESDRLNVLKVVTELNKNEKLCWLDQCELARKHGMKPFHDHSAEKIFKNDSFYIYYNSKERVYHHHKISNLMS